MSISQGQWQPAVESVRTYSKTSFEPSVGLGDADAIVTMNDAKELDDRRHSKIGDHQTRADQSGQSMQRTREERRMSRKKEGSSFQRHEKRHDQLRDGRIDSEAE